jgi:hypothetical protein
MWELRNNTPFAVDGHISIDKQGARRWVVIIKGTFDIGESGATRASDVQEPPVRLPVYRAEPGYSSLVYEQDLGASKPGTDIYLNATAYAPRGRPCTVVEVGLKSPCGVKKLAVHGDREWGGGVLGLGVSAARPFLQMPITWERAFGGYDHNDRDVRSHRMHEGNPVGTGITRPQGGAVPNIALPGQDVASEPCGYGALCSYWQPRRQFQGTYDDAWSREQKPLLPLDYDRRALLCAPADQQIGSHLRGGEAFAVLNMHPVRPVIEFCLPSHRFGLLTYAGQQKFDHRAEIDTVVIEPDVPRVLVTWRSELACHRSIDDIDYTVIVEKRNLS